MAEIPCVKHSLLSQGNPSPKSGEHRTLVADRSISCVSLYLARRDGSRFRLLFFCLHTPWSLETRNKNESNQSIVKQTKLHGPHLSFLPVFLASICQQASQ
jgi:hypothetical protein